MSKYLELTQHNFKEEVYEADKLVFIDFHTEGCGPCALMPPIMEELEKKFGEKVKFTTYDVDIDDVMDEKDAIVIKYDVMSYPTVMLFKDGEVKANLIGLSELEPLEKEIEKVL